MWDDSQGALSMVRNLLSSLCSKHINIDVMHQFVRLSLVLVLSDEEHMVAEMLTKPLPEAHFLLFRLCMGISLGFSFYSVLFAGKCSREREQDFRLVPELRDASRTCVSPHSFHYTYVSSLKDVNCNMCSVIHQFQVNICQCYLDGLSCHAPGIE